jgi:hypothetical protein
MQKRGSAVSKIREAAFGLEVRVFASDGDDDAEQAFSDLRRTSENSYFATHANGKTWRIHRLCCSSLSFEVSRKLTAKPKVCAAGKGEIREWAKRLGASVTVCKRCGNVK